MRQKNFRIAVQPTISVTRLFDKKVKKTEQSAIYKTRMLPKSIHNVRMYVHILFGSG